MNQMKCSDCSHACRHVHINIDNIDWEKLDDFEPEKLSERLNKCKECKKEYESKRINN